ncbi:pyridoxal-phosphate dependent enzyme [Boseaceae bacterium BT-24-1]|nr:pyridoxal-phosphate dependent enzyme [Boseaceae bacterium BT-24-1]
MNSAEDSLMAGFASGHSGSCDGSSRRLTPETRPVFDPSRSTAKAQRSLGPGRPSFSLAPALLEGCPVTSNVDMQYPLEIAYDYASVDIDALFAAAPGPGLDRWAPLLPPLCPRLSLGEGGTPLVEIPTSLCGTAGLGSVYLKDESRNPTGSHKDRLNLCTVSAAVLAGAKGIVVASSGNHGASTAAYAARAGLPCIVVTTTGISAGFQSMLRAYGAAILPVAESQRWPVLRELVHHAGFYPTSNLTDFHTGNPFGPEGYKTIAYEIFLQLGRRAPSVVVVPTGYGEQLFGIYKGFLELLKFGLTETMPRMMAVEPSARGPLHHALVAGQAAVNVPPDPTKLLSIACTVGSYRGVCAIEDSNGRVLLVDDDDVIRTREALARRGLWQELSGAAGVAALRQLHPNEAVGGSVVAIGCSSGFKDASAAADPLQQVEPAYSAIVDYLKSRYQLSISQQ